MLIIECFKLINITPFFYYNNSNHDPFIHLDSSVAKMKSPAATWDRLSQTSPGTTGRTPGIAQVAAERLPVSQLAF